MPESPWFHVALVEPSIPQNTGSIGRLVLAFDARLHLVGKLGFSIDEKACRRAGLDYWKDVDLATWDSLEDLERSLLPLPLAGEGRGGGPGLWLFSAFGRTPVHEVPFEKGDVLVFGNEQRGLPRELVEAAGERSVRIPIASPHVRSLNLANAVSIGAFEAARRLGFPADRAAGDLRGPRPLDELGPRDEPGRPRKSREPRGRSCAPS